MIPAACLPFPWKISQHVNFHFEDKTGRGKGDRLKVSRYHTISHEKRPLRTSDWQAQLVLLTRKIDGLDLDASGKWDLRMREELGDAVCPMSH
jgi:hypothetical protein